MPSFLDLDHDARDDGDGFSLPILDDLLETEPVVTSSIGRDEFQLPALRDAAGQGAPVMAGSDVGEFELPAVGGESDIVQPTDQGDAAGHGEPVMLGSCTLPTRTAFGKLELELPAVGG